MATNVSSEYRKLFGNDGGKNTEVVCCMDCFWANLIQYGNNPVLAECRKKPDVLNEKFPYQVEVASTRWICPMYSLQDRSEKSIQHRVSRSVA